MSPPPPDYSHSFAQTSDEHDTLSPTSLNPLSPLEPFPDVEENIDGKIDAPSTHSCESTINQLVVTQDETAYIEASPEDLIHPPDFRPFFTLIQDAETGEHHHPSIHYIFSDDDPAFLTSAVLENISLQDRQPEDLPHGERVVVLDVAPDGKAITHAQSLSSTWQLSNATLSQAPSWNEGTEAKRDGSMMLTIAGMEGHALHIATPRKASVESMLGRVESIISGYSERLSSLDRLVKKDILEQEDEIAEDLTEVPGAVDESTQ